MKKNIKTRLLASVMTVAMVGSLCACGGGGYMTPVDNLMNAVNKKETDPMKLLTVMAPDFSAGEMEAVMKSMMKMSDDTEDYMEDAVEEVNTWAGGTLCLDGEGDNQTSGSCSNGFNLDKKYNYMVYENYYMQYFKKALRDKTFSPKIMYINKYCWKIAFIALLCSDKDEVKNFLKDCCHYNDITDVSIKFAVDPAKRAMFVDHLACRWYDTISQNVDENGEINFLVVSHDSLGYQSEELERRGYVRDEAGDFDNVQHPLETNYTINLPEGFKQVYGDDIDDNLKAKACHYGFHPVDDDGILTGTFKEGALAYQGRKQSQFFKDSFESLIVTDDGDICTYCFCYVNKELSTAFIEPLCTREKYRQKGFSKQMLYGVINRLKEMGIESAYINSYDWRKKVYNSAGFETEDSIGFWHKKIR